jgi:hypothetical protein
MMLAERIRETREKGKKVYLIVLTTSILPLTFNWGI